MECLILQVSKGDIPIWVGPDALSKAQDIMKPYDQVMVVTDENVAACHSSVLEMLANKGQKMILKPGEQYKTLQTVGEILGKMVSAGLSRKSLLVALGGGVVGDLVGFCAAIYMRGIDVLQIPTTLLAQVDSGIGGKTGADLPEGKNLVGAFHQPCAVIVDPMFLSTLPKREMLCGAGEIAKYGVLEPSLFEDVKTLLPQLLRGDEAATNQLIRACCAIKTDVVSKDEFETKGLRKILNAGHTTAHAIEAASDFSAINHGEAVIIGLILEAFIAYHLNVLSKMNVEKMMGLLTPLSAQLQVQLSGISAEHLVIYATRDKKNVGQKISMMLPVDEGGVKEFLFTQDEAFALYNEAISEMKQRS